MEDIAACGGRGSSRGNVWRDIRSKACGSKSDAMLKLARILVLTLIQLGLNASHHDCKDLGLLPVDAIRMHVLARPEENKEDKTFMDLPIVPPHLLLVWLLRINAVRFNPEKAQEFWSHHRSCGTAWMQGRPADQGSATWEPWALYGDKAEYTITKEKILVVFCSS